MTMAKQKTIFMFIIIILLTISMILIINGMLVLRPFLDILSAMSSIPYFRYTDRSINAVSFE